jgi:hypothetical protein
MTASHANASGSQRGTEAKSVDKPFGMVMTRPATSDR